jgi:hypothetical protein
MFQIGRRIQTGRIHSPQFFQLKFFALDALRRVAQRPRYMEFFAFVDDVGLSLMFGRLLPPPVQPEAAKLLLIVNNPLTSETLLSCVCFIINFFERYEIFR